MRVSDSIARLNPKTSPIIQEQPLYSENANKDAGGQ